MAVIVDFFYYWIHRASHGECLLFTGICISFFIVTNFVRGALILTRNTIVKIIPHQRVSITISF